MHYCCKLKMQFLRWFAIVVFVALFGYTIVPFFFWSYSIIKAGQLMEEGLEWNDSAYADELPFVVNDNALKDALRYIDQATFWYPENAHAYRLAGWIHMARQEWEEAAQSFEKAQSLQSSSVMLNWEKGLACEQMVAEIESAPKTPILSYQEVAEENEIDYLDEQSFHQSSAKDISASVIVSRDKNALFFRIGFIWREEQSQPFPDERMLFLIRLRSANENRLLFQRVISTKDSEEVAEWLDLSSWQGQEVTVIFNAIPFSKANTTNQLGWLEIIFTTKRAAYYRTLSPYLRMRTSWLEAGYNEDVFLHHGDMERKAGNYKGALRWYKRTSLFKAEKFDTMPLHLDAEKVVLLEGFYNDTFVTLCNWCNNSLNSSLSIHNGILTMSFTNVEGQRDGLGVRLFTYILNNNHRELLIRLKGSPGTLVTIEVELDGKLKRLINYRPVSLEWDVWSIPVDGSNLSQVLIGIGELEDTANNSGQSLLIDWLILK